jgi:hypothetical protein
MTTIETVKGYIHRLCAEAGADPQQAYSAENEAWYFEKGPITLEVFFTTYTSSDQVDRTFLRCFSTIFPIPLDLPQRQEIYQISLEVNARNMGVKIGMMAERGYVYAIGERDIEGMDYREFIVLISDVAYWAENLSDMFNSRFGEPKTNLN